MCVSADVLLVQVKSVMNTRTKKGTPNRGCFFGAMTEDSNPSKCGADERRRRGLDRAEP